MREEKEVWVKRTKTILTCDQCGTVVESATTCSICERNICKECWGKNENRKIGGEILFEYACQFCMNVPDANGIIKTLVMLKTAEDTAIDNRYELMEKWGEFSRGGKKQCPS